MQPAWLRSDVISRPGPDWKGLRRTQRRCKCWFISGWILWFMVDIPIDNYGIHGVNLNQQTSLGGPIGLVSHKIHGSSVNSASGKTEETEETEETVAWWPWCPGQAMSKRYMKMNVLPWPQGQDEKPRVDIRSNEANEAFLEGWRNLITVVFEQFRTTSWNLYEVCSIKYAFYACGLCLEVGSAHQVGWWPVGFQAGYRPRSLGCHKQSKRLLLFGQLLWAPLETVRPMKSACPKMRYTPKPENFQILSLGKAFLQP